MPRIIFASAAALTCFASMAEGMEEVQRDDREDARADALLRLIAACGAQDGAEAPIAVEVEPRDVPVAQDVIENCLDPTAYMDPSDDPEREVGLFAGDAVLECDGVPDISLDMALDLAAEAVRQQSGPHAEAVRRWLSDIRDQRGCAEVAPSEGVDRLVTLIEIVVRG